ncbi:hypothetical protein CsSME_00043900 [Camellia sinensis var. sinensis]
MVDESIVNLFNNSCSLKKSGKGKRPGKGGNRYWKNVGLGFKTPRDAIEGIELSGQLAGIQGATPHRRSGTTPRQGRGIAP